MKDADLRRAYNRLCRKKPGTLIDTEAGFRSFKAGVEYGYTIEADARAEDEIDLQATMPPDFGLDYLAPAND